MTQYTVQESRRPEYSELKDRKKDKIATRQILISSRDNTQLKWR